jgi:hypothetical protein
MKKVFAISIFLSFMFLMNSVWASGNLITQKPVSSFFTTLVINADVTIILINNKTEEPVISGNQKLKEVVIMENRNDTLFINSSRRRNLKNAGVIYISSSYLRCIRINSEADVRSLTPLHAPHLDVVINGNCQFNISTLGKLNLRASESYTIDHSTEIRHYPSSLIMDKGPAQVVPIVKY